MTAAVATTAITSTTFRAAYPAAGQQVAENNEANLRLSFTC